MANVGNENETVRQRYYRRHRDKLKKDARERLSRWRKQNPEKYYEQRQKWAALNKDKLRANARKYYKKNSHKNRGRTWVARLKKEYGITPEIFANMLVEQKGRCAICQTANPGGIGNWHVDHDHSTKQVRGLLCNKCNLALGLFRDSEHVLAAACVYLQKAKTGEINNYVQ